MTHPFLLGVCTVICRRVLVLLGTGEDAGPQLQGWKGSGVTFPTVPVPVATGGEGTRNLFKGFSCLTILSR